MQSDPARLFGPSAWQPILCVCQKHSSGGFSHEVRGQAQLNFQHYIGIFYNCQPHRACALLQMDVLPLEDFNPYGNGFTYTETELTTEKMAQRVTNAETARVWKIKNPARPSAVTGVYVVISSLFACNCPASWSVFLPRFE